MFFKVATVSILAYLVLAHTPAPAPAAAPGAGPPPAPMVVVVPAAATMTRVVDVRRADLERAMREPNVARFVPSMRHGGVSGVKVYAIRPGSPLTAIGIENGDTLRAVNDVPIASADSVLEAYRVLREPDHYDLDIDRRGQRLRIVVLVH